MTQRIPYARFTGIGLIFSLLIAVLIVGPNILFRGADVLEGMNEYMVSVAAFFLTWCLNILGLRLFQSRSNKPRAIRQRQALSFIIIVSVIIALHYIFDFHRPPPPRPGVPFSPDRIPAGAEWVKLASGLITGVSLNLLVLMSLEVLMLRNTKTEIEADNVKLREEKLQAVNLMLKQQIQPHFLFNSLNTIKSLIHRDADKAEEYLLKLSDFLRRSISTGDNATVLVSEELTLCSDYLDLQSVRFGAALKHEFHISQATKEKGHLPPFSLQLLVENAIKHNVLTERAPLTIVIKEDNGWISVSNNLQLRSMSEESTGIGLANLSARYESIANAEIDIEQTETEFTVRIKIL